jgi:hypothetical protein
MTMHLRGTREEWLAARLQTAGAGNGALDRALNGTLGVAHWLSLAAAPTFAIMALTSVLEPLGGPPDMLCSAMQGASPLSGMVPMYVLMSAFHLTPWLKLISGGRTPTSRPDAIPATCERPDPNDPKRSHARSTG